MSGCGVGVLARHGRAHAPRGACEILRPMISFSMLHVGACERTLRGRRYTTVSPKSNAKKVTRSCVHHLFLFTEPRSRYCVIRATTRHIAYFPARRRRGGNVCLSARWWVGGWVVRAAASPRRRRPKDAGRGGQKAPLFPLRQPRVSTPPPSRHASGGPSYTAAQSRAPAGRPGWGPSTASTRRAAPWR